VSAPARPTFLVPDELTGQVVKDILVLVTTSSPTVEQMDTWAEFELLIVYDWAWREYLNANDNLIRRRPRPAGLLGAR
jgi:hypothetical protein